MARRKTEVFSLAFLDVIACGFGAVVLFYTILSAQAGMQREKRNDDLQAEVNRLEEQVLEGYKNLVVLRNSVESTDEAVPAEGLAARIIEETERLKQQLAEAEKDTLSRRETIEKLKQDLKSLEEGTRRLSAGTPSPGQPGARVKGFVGSGDRQYLTGLKLGGQRILILVDVSASMMDDSVVNVIRLRNMPESRRLAATKWRRTVATVDWITAQLPAKSQFQAFAFNTQARALVAGSEGRWLDAGDGAALNDVLRELRRTVPKDGTSLENAFAAAARLSPRPDNILLVTDGLPTQGASPPAVRKTIDGEARLRLFERALARLPAGVPVNVILLPMEGDPLAPSAFWTLARRTNGSFLSPARDWP
ncbi:MAG: VWA domain-containing protein [Lysobacterales bacterium]|jgi:Mg-chelatase subunit ChlD|nr:MAG: VWA domain-containing protein [Xanthomonadales bacterium]